MPFVQRDQLNQTRWCRGSGRRSRRRTIFRSLGGPLPRRHSPCSRPESRLPYRSRYRSVFVRSQQQPTQPAPYPQLEIFLPAATGASKHSKRAIQRNLKARLLLASHGNSHGKTSPCPHLLSAAVAAVLDSYPGIKFRSPYTASFGSAITSCPSRQSKFVNV